MGDTILETESPTDDRIDPLGNLLSSNDEPRTLGQSLFRADANLPMKTRLTGNLVSAIAIAEAYDNIYDLPELRAFSTAIMKGRVSLGGKGRDEGVEIGKNTDNRNNGGINIMR